MCGRALLGLPQTRANELAAALAMCAGKHRDPLTLNLIPKQIRESVQNSAPNLAVYFLTSKRHVFKLLEGFTKLVVEIFTKPDTPLFIPSLRFLCIKFCEATDINGICQTRRRRRRA